MFSQFAYSREMQIILMFCSFTFNFVIMYLTAKIILRIYGEEASVGQKALFAFLTGMVLQSLWVYLCYYIGGMVSFTKLENLLIASPNPITAVLYCYFGIKIFKLSPIRSIELMGHVYVYFSIIICLNRMAGAYFFPQADPAHFNYLWDAVRHVFNLLLCFAIYGITWRVLDHHPGLFVSKAATFAHPKRDLLVFMVKAIFVYLCLVIVPLVIPGSVVANVFIFVILALFFSTTLLFRFYQHTKADMQNKETHIDSLIKSMDEFRGIKHDFNNILHTYSGYFAIGDLEACKEYHASLLHLTTQAEDLLEVGHRMGENPALISLILEKHIRAEQMNVDMSVLLKYPLSDLPMKDIDICRIVGCLLDNAMEAAAETTEKRVSFTVEQKADQAKLMIITNSASSPLDVNQMLRSGVTTKLGHQGIGLSSVRKIMDRYANCSFQLSHCNDDVVAYLELK